MTPHGRVERWVWCYKEATRGLTDTRDEARRELERHIGIPLSECIEKVSQYTTYYYLTKADVETDVTRSWGGAYTGRITRVEVEE